MLALTLGIEYELYSIITMQGLFLCRPGLMAIVIVQAQAIIGTFYWGMRAYVEAEQAFNGIGSHDST